MKTFLKITGLVIVGLAIIYFIPRKQPEPVVVDFHTCVDAGYPVLETFPEQCKTPDGRTFANEVEENPEVVIDTPKWGDLVASPLRVSGKARGNWYFEANLPVKLEDQNGKILAQKGFHALGEWMTTDYVPFDDILIFSQPETEFGRLIIEKDNPSGLPENDASFAIPVKFK